jgi:hypothetical protein
MSYLSGETNAGWGVVRELPWHFVGVFETQVEAAARAIDMGVGYVVHYGEHRGGTDDFVWGNGDFGT